MGAGKRPYAKEESPRPNEQIASSISGTVTSQSNQLVLTFFSPDYATTEKRRCCRLVSGCSTKTNVHIKDEWKCFFLINQEVKKDIHAFWTKLLTMYYYLPDFHPLFIHFFLLLFSNYYFQIILNSSFIWLKCHAKKYCTCLSLGFPAPPLLLVTFCVQKHLEICLLFQPLTFHFQLCSQLTGGDL